MQTRITESMIENFISITGTNKIQAKNMLTVCNSNLEMAVNMFLEGGLLQSDNNIESACNSRENNSFNDYDGVAGASNDNSIKIADDDDVRAPIPQQQTVLVEDQYHALPYSRPRRKEAASSVFDRCRDFQKETEEHEKQLKSKSSSSKARKKRLHELFRPPVDILHQGDFQSARSSCNLKNKWLLVNIHKSIEFPCQVLNRDVWANKVVREIVTANFILWQVDHDSDEGMHYQTFYNVKNYPHIAVVDPRTGERLIVWENLGMKPSADQFAELATLFLSEHPSLNASFEVDQNIANTKNERISIIDDSEDVQLEAALKASLEQEDRQQQLKDKITYDTSSSSDHSESEVDIIESPHRKRRRRKEEEEQINHIQNSTVMNDEKPLVAHNDIKPPSGTHNDEKKTSLSSVATVTKTSESSCSSTENQATILLRLPDNTRSQLTISLDSLLKDLVSEVSRLGYSSTQYELIKAFPRVNLTLLEDHISLSKAGLHKQETIFVQDR